MADLIVPGGMDKGRIAPGSPLIRLGSITGGISGNPAVRRAAPWAAAVGVLGVAAASWALLAAPPQRTLNAGLSEADKAVVADALGSAGIAYALDRDTGAITVADADYHRARMLTAAGDLPVGELSATEMLDGIPMGASRNVERERLRLARERDLAQSIGEIDGVLAARVHLAEAAQSLFVRDTAATRASVVLTLANGAGLSQGQAMAITRLVAGSVSGLSSDNVSIIDQNGRLLSDDSRQDGGLAERLQHQAQTEDKIRTQVEGLLSPMFGSGNVTVEVQADIDLSEKSAARETYDKDNAVIRSESSERAGEGAVAGLGPGAPNVAGLAPGDGAGIPGATTNVPPPASVIANGPPGAGAGAVPPGNAGAAGSEAGTKSYEIGRELSVTRNEPGAISRLSVAVVVRDGAAKKLSPRDIEQLTGLVRSAVGFSAARGDQVAVIAREFAEVAVAEPPLWQQPWLLDLIRTGGALLVALLVLLFAWRPLMARLRPRAVEETASDGPRLPAPAGSSGSERETTDSSDDRLAVARALAAQSPERAAAAIRAMLAAPPAPAGAPR